MLQAERSAIQATALPTSIAFLGLYAAAVVFVRRRYLPIVFGTVLALGLAGVYIFATPPEYAAKAELIIDTHRLTLLKQQNSSGMDLPLDSAMIESQVEILKSDKIALSVIKSLHLADQPEFVGPSGSITGTLLGLVSRTAAKLFGPDLFSSDSTDLEVAQTRKALERFVAHLTIRRVGLTYVIDIGFQSTSPSRAAEIANAVAEAYEADSLEGKYESSRRAALWLQDRLGELRLQATAADRAEVDFKAKNNIIDAGGRLLNEQQVAELSSALVTARAQTAEALARRDRVQQILQTEKERSDFKDTATVTDSLHNDVVTRLREQYLDLAAREANWTARYGRDHLATVNLRNQMREIRNSIDDELRRIAQTYTSDYEIARSREEAVQKGLDEIVSKSNETSRAQIMSRELDATAQSYRALADSFLQQYVMSVQQQSFPITDVRLISPARPPARKSYPKMLLVLTLAGMGGMLAGVGIGMVRDLSDRVYRTSLQVEHDLGVDCIAVVPAVTKAACQPKAVLNIEEFGPRTIVRDASLLWHTADAPFSCFTEAIRSIKIAADLDAMTRSGKVIAVTSALPNEGKSTIATSLAQLISQGGSKVILVDADLRNPSLTRTLAPDAGAGVIEVMAGEAALEDMIWMDPSTKVHFLPGVMKTRLPHTGEVLASEAAKKLLHQLRLTFDYVIVDLSPLAPVIDVRATTHLIDAYILVVEWGRTRIDVVQHALGASRGVYEKLLGVVLNKADINVLPRYESYLAKSYNFYNSRYGYTE